MLRAVDLLVGVFVLGVLWVLLVAAVSVGVEQGLKRYHGETASLFPTTDEDDGEV